MKKILALLLVFVLMLGIVAGCSTNGDDTTTSKPVSSDEAISSDDSALTEEPESSDEPVSSDEEIDEPEDMTEDPYADYEYEDDPEDEEEEFFDTPLTPEQQRMETMLLGEDEELNKDALYSEGDLSRLAKAMQKSKAGKTVRLVFYGNGANTGRLMNNSTVDVPYSSIVYDWWQENIGPCEVIKAGTDNLTSITACMRVEHDVLRYEPDVVFLDFAVQDGIGAMAKTNALGYDNLIRLILQSKNSPAVISLMLTGAEQQSYTMNPLNASIFGSASKEQKKVAEYYNLPIIDFEQAFWDNSVEIVEVTTQKEIPLVSWYTIGTSNIAMNSDGHTILAGTIKYFFNKVLNKLSKISTKDYAYPTEGYFGNNKYMNISYVSIGDIIEDTAKGYTVNLSLDALAENEYSYTSEDISNPMTPNIRTWRHFDYIEGTHDAAYETKEENPEYLTITLPKAVEGDVYVLFGSTADAGKNIPSSGPIKDYAPITVECYDANDKLLGSVKPGASNFAETSTTGRSSTAKLLGGTTKITIKVYVVGGTIYINGISYFLN